MSSNEFLEFLNNINSHPLRVLNAAIPNSKYIPLDLSVTNTNIRSIDTSSTESFSKYINKYIKKHKAVVAFGGYNETRNIYKRSLHFNNQDAQEERNIHLGIDLWCDEGTVIHTPLDAKIHSFKNNINFGDYGPTIILEHQINGDAFYTLYGHLSSASLENIKKGQCFKQGEPIARLGSSQVNGDYPPHLHFQIIKDIQHFKGDYPGVCSNNDLSYYLNNCPNPEVLLKLNI